MMTEYTQHITPKPEDIGALYDIGVFERIDGKLKCDFNLLLMHPVMRSYLLSLIVTNINKHKSTMENVAISSSDDAIAFTSIIADTLKLCLKSNASHRFVLNDEPIDNVVDIEAINGDVVFTFSFIGDTAFSLFDRTQVLEYKFINHHFIARKLEFIRERKHSRRIYDLRGKTMVMILNGLSTPDSEKKIVAIIIDPIELMQMSSARMTFEQFIIKFKEITLKNDIMVIADINARSVTTIASPHASSTISVINYAHMVTVDLSIGDDAIGKIISKLKSRCLQGRIALLGNMIDDTMSSADINEKKIKIIEKNRSMFAGALYDTIITSPGMLTIAHHRINKDNFVLT